MDERVPETPVDDERQEHCNPDHHKPDTPKPQPDSIPEGPPG